MRLKGLAQNLALLLGALLLTAALVELAARVYVSSTTRVRQDPEHQIARFSATLGWDKPPGGHMRIRREEFDVEIALNGHGLRGPDRDYAKPPGTRRVLILGDSFGEGYYVEEASSARAVLESLLNGAPSCRAEVINGATAGYSTDQEYLFFESEGLKYQPDLVLVFLYYNDLFGNTTPNGTGGKPKPYFELDGGKLALRNTPVPRPDPGRPGLRPFHGSLALRLLSNRVADGSPRLQAALARLGLVEKPATTTNMEFAVFGPRHRGVDEMWQRTAAILAALKASVEGKGGRLAILYVPARVEANDAAWESVRETYELGDRWHRDRVRQHLASLGHEMGIPVIDPTLDLRRAEQPNRPAYFAQDGHWNAIGNAVAAHVLEPHVREALGCPDSAKR